MRIFNHTNTPDSWGNKVNFADDQNVLVGFDMAQNCLRGLRLAPEDARRRCDRRSLHH